MLPSPRNIQCNSLLGGSACLVIIIAGLKSAQNLVTPFLLAAFIAVLCLPLLHWLEKRRIPTAINIMLLLGLLIAVSVLLTLFIGTSLGDFSQAMPTYQERLHQQTAILFSWLQRFGIKLSGPIIYDYFDPGAAMKVAARTLSSFGAVLTNGFLILLTVIFILFEASSVPRKLQQALPHPEQSMEQLTKVITSVQSYLVIKTMVSLLTGICVAAWLLYLGVDYPFLWGLVAFMLNYVPNIGSIIAAVPPLLLGLVQYGASTALLVLLGYVVVNVVVGNVIEPRYMGKQLGLSPLVVLISLITWGWVLGPVGMLLSVPLTMIVKIALEATEEWRWIAILLS